MRERERSGNSLPNTLPKSNSYTMAPYYLPEFYLLPLSLPLALPPPSPPSPLLFFPGGDGFLKTSVGDFNAASSSWCLSMLSEAASRGTRCWPRSQLLRKRIKVESRWAKDQPLAALPPPTVSCSVTSRTKRK